MRWQDLFADLEQQWVALAESERAAEVAERTRAEFAQVPLADRLRASVGRPVRLLTRGHREVSGELSRVGADFVLVSQARRECVVPFAALGSVSGLGPESLSVQAAGQVWARLALGSVLRRVAADRSPVRVRRGAGNGTDGPGPLGADLTGTVQRVGADFLELAEHALDEPARRPRQLTVVAFGAIDLLCRETPG